MLLLLGSIGMLLAVRLFSDGTALCLIFCPGFRARLSLLFLPLKACLGTSPGVLQIRHLSPLYATGPSSPRQIGFNSPTAAAPPSPGRLLFLERLSPRRVSLE